MFAKKIGIDLGSSTVQVYVRGEGIVLDEPSVVAVDRTTSRFLAVGHQAIAVAGRTPGSVRLARPVRGGSIANLALAEAVLVHLISRVQGRQRLFRPEVMICVSAAASGTERRALTEAAIAAGARQAWLIEIPLAAAMGVGMSVAERRPHTVADIGGGSAQVGVIWMSGMLVSGTVTTGGEQLDEAIVTSVRERHGVTIDEPTAEAAKIAAGSARTLARPLSVQVRGAGPEGGQRTVTLTSAELTDVIADRLQPVVAVVRGVLRQLPPAVATDVAARGLVLTGGCARLRGIDRFLMEETGLPARVADDPVTCAVRGTRRALGEFEVLQRRQLYLR